jgi:hypothetical protein
MKKIILSVLAIVLTVGVVSGAAYALFSSTVTVSGITFFTGYAGLKVTDSQSTVLVSDSAYSAAMTAKLGNLYPGFQDYTNVDFLNNSSSNIGLNLSMQLTSAGGNWGELSNMLYIAVTPQGTAPTGSDWHTLAAWNAAPINFGTTLAHNATSSYRISFAVDSTADSSIANMQLTGVTFVLTGTQAP